MVIMIVAGVLILAIIFFQAVQGLLSALITAILSVLAAAVALNYFEPLAETMLGAGRLGDYAYGLSLLVLFAVPLVVLRVLFDRLIPGNVVLGLWPDRAGGAVFGAVTSMLLVGMAMLAIQMTPFPGTILGYAPYKASLEPEQAGPPMWASDFTLGLAKRLSSGSLSAIGGSAEFGTAHRNLAREAFCLRSRPPGGRMATPTDALKVTEAFVTAPGVATQPPLDAEAARVVRIQTSGREMLQKRLLPPAGHAIMVFRVTVSDQARDPDDWWRLPAGHFKLIVDDGRDFYPVGYLTFCGRWQLEAAGVPGLPDITPVAVERPWSEQGGPDDLTVDWVYSLPTDVKPVAMAFRMAARSGLPPLIEGLPRPDDSKTGRMLALAVAPAEMAGEFKDTPAERILQPKRMERDEKIPREMGMRVSQTQNPAGAEVFELDQDKQLLKRIRFKGPIAGLIADPRGTVISGIEMKKDYRVVTVQCAINPKGTDSIRDLVNSAVPELILDNRRMIPHCGAYLIYESGGVTQAVFTFDADLSRPARKLEPILTEAWQENLATVKSLTFIFPVPPDPDRGAAGLKLTADAKDVPGQEFYTLQPVMLKPAR